MTKRNFPKASKNDPSSEICPNDTVGGGGGIDNDVGGVLLRKYDRCPFAAIDELDTNKKEINAFFSSPMAYIFLVVFALINGYFFNIQFFLINE